MNTIAPLLPTTTDGPISGAEIVARQIATMAKATGTRSNPATCGGAMRAFVWKWAENLNFLKFLQFLHFPLLHFISLFRKYF